MQTITGSLVQDEKIVAEVTLFYEQRIGPDGWSRWDGTLEIISGMPGLEEYAFRSVDGKTCQLVINSTSMGSHQGPRFTFIGSGPPPM